VTFVLRCEGATGLPVVTDPLQDGCIAAGGALVFVESESLNPFGSPQEMVDFVSVAVFFFAVVWVGRQLRKSA
jgi:hypothetical protein